MFKKLMALMIAVILVISLTACSDKHEETVKNKNGYVAYVGIGTGRYSFLFDGDIKNKKTGVVKMITMKEYEEKEKNYDNMEALRSGTYQYTPENNTLCIALDVDGKESIETCFVKGDYLIPDTLIGQGTDVHMSGGYLDCEIRSGINVIEYHSDGTYDFYELDYDYNIDYLNSSSGVYYIKDDLIYRKEEDTKEYWAFGLILENKLYDLTYNHVWKRDN